MFDGFVPVKKVGDDSDNEVDMKLHITLIVDISRGGASTHWSLFVLHGQILLKFTKFSLGGWSERTMDLIWALISSMLVLFKTSWLVLLFIFLHERSEKQGVSMTIWLVFLHPYIANKDKVEYIRWMEKVNSYFQKSRS